MNNLEFRVWSVEYEMFFYWNGYQFCPTTPIVTDCGYAYIHWLELPDNNKEQYTGRKDKNSVKVFDGDIIGQIKSERNYKDPSNPIVTEGQYDHFYLIQCVPGGFSLTHKNKKFIHSKYDIIFPLVNCELEKHEVIGNIHESPELLK